METELGSHFEINFQKLEELNDIKNIPQKYEKLQEMGGVQEIVRGLGVDPRVGIPNVELPDLTDRVREFGVNVYPEAPHSSLLELFFEALQDTTIIILCVAAIISLVLGIALPPKGEEQTAWIEGFAIIVAVLLVGSVTSMNNYNQEKQFRNLSKTNQDIRVKVLRGGEMTQISIFELTVGDIVFLDTGNSVPADGLFLDGHEMRIDESVMTGEAVTVKKDHDHPFMLSGCQVTEGLGSMVVTAVGTNSEWGKTMAKLQVQHPPTPLQESLGDMAELIGKAGLSVAIIVFVILTIYWIVDVSGKTWDWSHINDLVSYFIIAVTIVVVAVPEGLPLAVTISLAYSIKQMMADNNLVRHLAACEVMGGATDICSDKTGTLTENRMTVTHGIIAGREFASVPLEFELDQQVLKLVSESAIINTAETSDFSEQPGQPIKYIGNPTECAIIHFCHKLGVKASTIRQTFKPRIKKLYPFSSSRKRMSSIVEYDGIFRMYSKGAPDMMIRRSTSILTEEGRVIELTDEQRQILLHQVEEMASDGLRTLALCFRDFPLEWNDEDDCPAGVPTDEPPENNFIIIGILGIMDPIRKEVPEAVRLCQKAGITVRMVTGDYISTARKIATDCGILTHEGIALEGPEFAKMSDEALDEVLPRLQVLARSLPADKFRLVERLKFHKQIVAATGDGTNDAPALKAADVGCAMGIAGTEVAKEASDIIIMDDNFRSIVRAVLWGRSIFDNIRKFLQFQLTVNFAALMVAMIAALSKSGEPLKAVQLLWVNLIMDTMAALALGTERPTPDLLERKPINVHEQRLISNIMARNIIGQGLYQVLVLLFLLWCAPFMWDVPRNSDHHFTLIFNAFVWCQIFNEINSRKISDESNIMQNFFANWIFSAILVITAALQILIVEFGGHAFHTHPLDVGQWLICVLIGLLSIPLGVVLRMIPVPPMPEPKGRFRLPSLEESSE
eukprot:TRINITY_DN1290_c0_g1_i1.p1 TRINITY_DN1290_c0_g1~~TRINITY_DN1290_c0_g1_i1.p1  ORF type:complete len:959 (-),score=237.92 TRINITY_DN1290_c0_g1_i1:216-3092(-)